MGSLLQNQGGSSNTKNEANLVQNKHPFDGHFAYNVMSSMGSQEWIIDSGASSHICCSPELLHTTYKLDKPTVIYLPDGSSRSVAYVGMAKINKNLMLTGVLYVPGFTSNLISVSQLIKTTDLKCVFHPTHCLFQTAKTDEIVGIGKMKDHLY